MVTKIKTDSDYRAALAEIERLLERDPEPGTEDSRNLELLGLVIDDYESKSFPFPVADPVDAIEFRMEQQGLAPRDLIPFIGSRSKVSEVLSRKRSLTVSMIRALHAGLKIPAKSLIQETKDTGLEEQPDLANFPVHEMVARGWIDDSANALRAFLNSLSPAIRPVVLYRQAQHIRSARKMDKYALVAWTARIVLRARQETVGSNYRAGTVNLEFMRETARRSRYEHGPIAAKDFLLEHGIPLIIEPHLPHTYLDGAAILLHADRPIIGMSIRHDRLDNFWFTLMHECAHVSLHSGEGAMGFIDDLDVGAQADPKEEEADRLAGEALIPEAIWRSSPLRNLPSPGAAQRLATQIGVHPSIVAGRLRREWKAFRSLNSLVGHRQVRKEFTNVMWPG